MMHSRCLRGRMTLPHETGMISHVASTDTTQTREPTEAHPDGPKPHWWSRLSPWLWGLLALVLIVGTQVPRIHQVFSSGAPKPAAVATTGTPQLSGVDYSQAMAATANFVDANLDGARLENLDLRGKEFTGTDAAGAIFSGSLLNGADFTGADLRGANFSNACLQGSNLTGAQLAGANFTGADVAGASIAPATIADTLGWDSVPTASICYQS